MAITAGSSWLAGTGLGGRGYDPNRGALPTIGNPTYVPQASIAPSITIASPSTPPIVAGIEPQAYEAILYGKDIPLFVGGKMPIGGRICEGPFFGGTQADPTVSFIAYHAQNIVEELFTDTVITEARLRGQAVWNAASGYIATDKLPSGSFAWNPGHVLNVAFPQSVARYGSNAVPYTGGITSSWENIPLKPFGGIVPFPTVLVENSDGSYGNSADGITRNQAITNVLRRMGLEDFEFEVNVSGSDPAWMVANNMSLPDFLGQLRAIFTQYHITYSDKLRIIEPASFAVVGELTNSNIQRDSLKFRRTDPMTLTREKRYTYIDVDRDYEMNTALAKEDRYPIPTTDGTASVSIELPIATTAAQAVADIHNSLYDELKSRSQMDGIVDRTLFGLECADGVRFADSPVISMTARVMETVHDFENMTVQFKAAEVLNCGAQVDPHFGEVILLLNFDGTIDDASPLVRGPMTAAGDAHVTDDGLVLDGSGDLVTTDIDQLSVLSSTNTSPFTIEVLANFSAINVNQILFSVDTGLGGRIFQLRQAGDDEITFRWTTAASLIYDAIVSTTGANIVTGENTFIVVDKDSTGKVRIYVRGVMHGSDTPADSTVGDIAPMVVGATGLNVAEWFHGTVRRVRVTRGISRYGDVNGDGSFTPPTAPFPEM